MAWHCKPTGGYVLNSPTGWPDPDGEDNINEIWSMLRTRGWTETAAAGFLACVGLESGYNPWRWQGGPPSVNTYKNIVGSGRAYGLVQWDPASYLNYDRPNLNKYIDNPNSINLPGYGPNFSDQTGNTLDGAAQIAFIDSFGWIGQYFPSTDYPYYGTMCPSYASFKADTTHTPADLATVWAANFERSQGVISSKPWRDPLADHLYQMLSGAPARKFPAWLLLRWRQQMINGKGHI